MTGVRRSGVAALAAFAVLITGCSPVDQPPPTPAPRAAFEPMPLDSGPVVDQAATAAPTAFVQKGNGIFVNQDAMRRVGDRPDEDGDITVNFVDVDIRDVVHSVLGGMLNVSYTVDPQIQGAVTVQTTRPVSKAALLPMLEDLLRVNGAALVQAGTGYRVMPAENARLTVPPRMRGAGAPGSGFRVEMVPMRFIAAQEMSRILENLVPADRILRVDSQRNMLIVAGTKQEVASILDLVDTFDVDWLKGMSFALTPLKAAKPEEMVEDLQKVFGDPVEGPNAGLVSFMPVQRLNAVLVMSARQDYLAKAQDWIEQFDQPGENEAGNLYVYYVQNNRAADLAGVLNDVFGSGGGAAEPAVTAAPGRQLVESAPLDRPPSAAGRASRSKMGALREAKSGGTVERAAAPAAAAATAPAAAAATAFASHDRPAVLAAPGGVRIIADEKNNALVIMASPQDYRMVEATLRRLDILPMQVLIEATIIEVALNDQLRFGVQWFFEGGRHRAVLSEVAGGAVAQAFPGFSYLFQAGQDVRVVLNALSSVTDVNVVSAPQLLVLDNQTARMQVGDEVPVASRSVVSVLDPDAPIVNSIEFRDTGVILEVTPRVNASGLVMMDIRQEVSDVAPNRTSGIDSPVIQQRQFESSVAVHSGETVALGGLIRDNQSRSNAGVPFLSEIPILGYLFGARTNLETRTELLVLITPRVVRTPQDARGVTDELRARMRRLTPIEYRAR